MRYRHLNCRYTLVLTADPLRTLPHTSSIDQLSIAQSCWRPAVDVYETKKSLIVLIELSGVDTNDLDILLYEDALIIEGQRRLPASRSKGVYHMAEIRQGAFRLELLLPAIVDAEQVTTTYENGLLRLRLIKIKRLPNE
jgi:HSP20 family protein